MVSLDRDFKYTWRKIDISVTFTKTTRFYGSILENINAIPQSHAHSTLLTAAVLSPRCALCILPSHALVMEEESWTTEATFLSPEHKKPHI